ncbi:peptidase M16 [Legionella impletisoli]|uniref:Peptidase M16 n=2 Tax=Legionella impletisoli TaxID=343510 RepID=A0A917JRN4_9GAMM|nr:pitrilysin family protein [Legionella impletisoli]GGI83019.1 peptidase M16 [Legionella impletisoli]
MRRLIAFCSLFLTVSSSMAASSLKPSHWNTSNGAKVVFYQAMEVPMLNVKVAFAAGSAHDGDKFGLSALTTDLLNQGNDGKDASTVAELLADTGAQYQAESTRDMVVLDLKTLTEPLALNGATDIFAKIISKPDFLPGAFEREKSQQLMAIDQALESPNEVANQAFFRVLYQDHPYAHPILGTSETVQQLTLDEVRHFYKSFFVGKNTTVILVGAIEPNQAKDIAEKITQGLKTGIRAPDILRALPLAEDMNVEVPFPSSQTVIRLGELGITHQNKYYFPLIVGNYILGGGSLVSQLALEVREKRGLTYGIHSEFLPLSGVGPFLISLATKTNQADTALDITRKVLTKFMQQGPTVKELAEAKQYLIGSFPLAIASNSSIADVLLKIAFYDLPNDYLETYLDKINAVTQSEIKTAFKTTLTPSKLLQVTVGKP